MGSSSSSATKRTTRTTRSGRAAGTEGGRPKGATDAERGMAAPAEKKDGARRRPTPKRSSG
jgi:hypothetical protein